MVEQKSKHFGLLLPASMSLPFNHRPYLELLLAKNISACKMLHESTNSSLKDIIFPCPCKIVQNYYDVFAHYCYFLFINYHVVFFIFKRKVCQIMNNNFYVYCRVCYLFDFDLKIHSGQVWHPFGSILDSVLIWNSPVPYTVAL